MKSTMVTEHTVTLSNGETFTAAPYESIDMTDAMDTLREFNRSKPSWLPALLVTHAAARPIAWMR